MQILNLPPFSHRIKESNGATYIFDEARKKYIFLSPEEWVRQHLLHYLMRFKNYPKSLIKIESGTKFNKLSKRTDLLVHDREGAPFLLAECKSFEVKLSDSTIKQISTYNMTIKAPYLVITNGMDLFCWNTKDSKSEFLKDIPDFA